MKRVLLILFFYFLQAPYFAGICGETGERNFTDEKPTLVAGYSKKIFFNVNINDARASAKVLTETSMQDEQKTYLSNYLRNFHTHTEGKQLITLFRVNRLVPFNPSYLETVEALLKEHQGLKVRLTKKR